MFILLTFNLFDTTVSQDRFIHTKEVPMSQEYILMNSYSINNENYLIRKILKLWKKIL